MASVAMHRGGSWRFEGYPITETAYCLYCDQCGSFKITCWIPIPKWMGVVLCIVTLVVALKYTWHPALAIGAPVALLILSTSDSIRHSIHICRECGNTHITRDNVRGYPEFDRSVLDTSYEATIKYYLED